MTYSMQDLVRDRCPDIKNGARLVLLELARRANEHGTCWPSARLLAYDTCLSYKSVENALDALEEAAVIFVQHRVGLGDIFTLNLPMIDSLKKDERFRPSSPNRAVNLTGYQECQVEAVQNDLDTLANIAGATPANISFTPANISTPPANIAGVPLQILQTNNTLETHIEKQRNSTINSLPPTSLSLEAGKEKGNERAPIMQQVAGADEEFNGRWQAFWGAYPARGRKDKPTVRQAFLSAGSKKWAQIVQAATNYAASSEVAKRNMVMNAMRFIEGECWEAYVDGPLVEKDDAEQNYSYSGGTRPGGTKDERTNAVLEAAIRRRAREYIGGDNYQKSAAG